MDPHLRDLRYFVAVAEELHFTQAATRLKIAQPTLSRQIKHLEDQLGVLLFDRHQRSVALTVAGKDLLEQARKLLAQWDEVEQQLHGAGETLRVGLQDGVRPRVLDEFTDRTFEFSVSPLGDQSCGLASRRSDIAIVWVAPEPDRYTARVLRSEPRWVLMPEQHELADVEGITFEALLDEPFVALPAEAGPLRDYWLATDARAGREPNVAVEAATAEEMLESVGLGQGLSLIAAGNAEMYPWPGVVAVPVVDLDPCVLLLVWRADEGRRHVLDFVDQASTPRALSS